MKIGYLNSIIQNIPIKTVCKIYYLRWWYNGWHYWAFRPGETNMITEGEEYRTIGTRKVTMGSGHISYNQVQAIRSILLTREVYILTSYGWKNIRVEQGSVITYKNQINGYEIEITTTIGSKEISLTGYSPVDDIPEVDPGDPGICERTIGSLIWSCKNYDSLYPNYMVYENDIVFVGIYGCLYTYDQIMSDGFVPTGWHISTLAEWQNLIAEAGGTALAGGVLKEVGTSHWNAGVDGTDDFLFTALGGGSANPARKSTGFNVYGNFWTADLFDSTHAYYVRMYYNSAALEILNLSTSYYLSVRLVKDIPPIFDDWYLPSEGDANLMYINLKAFGVGGFGNAAYWNSSEFDAANGRYVDFTNGFLLAGPKGAASRVRAVRSFTAVAGVYALRDTGPAGGLIFNIVGGTTYYESMQTDQGASRTWSNITAVAVTGTSQAIGTGLANTNLIIAQAGHTDSAASICKDLVI